MTRKVKIKRKAARNERAVRAKGIEHYLNLVPKTHIFCLVITQKFLGLDAPALSQKLNTFACDFNYHCIFINCIRSSAPNDSRFLFSAMRCKHFGNEFAADVCMIHSFLTTYRNVHK